MTTITREWLQQTIAEFENTRDDIPFGLSDDDAKILIVLKRALAVIDAEPVRYLNKFSGTCVTLEQQSNAADDVAVYIPLYAAPPAPAVIQSSQLLHDFYRAYADWLISGGDGQFSCVNGLCANLFDYCDRKGVGSAQALNEMHVQFVTAGMNEKLPFNTSVTDFDAESADGKCHLNTARRKWVFRRIIDGVKPVPVVPDEWTIEDAVKFCRETGRQDAGSAMEAWNACRTAMLNAEPLRAIQTAPALDFLNKNAAPLHATPKGNRLRIAEGEFAAYFPQERPVSGARVIAWDESGHLLGIGFGRDTRGSGIAIVVEGKKYDSNHIIHWCNYPAIPEGLNIRAIAALRAAVRNQWLKSDNFADKVYWKSMHSIANEIVEAMMKNEPHQPTENHIPSREAIIAGGVLVQCPRCYNDSYRLNVNGLTHYWCDKCANSITSESK